MLIGTRGPSLDHGDGRGSCCMTHLSETGPCDPAARVLATMLSHYSYCTHRVKRKYGHTNEESMSDGAVLEMHALRFPMSSYAPM